MKNKNLILIGLSILILIVIAVLAGVMNGNKKETKKSDYSSGFLTAKENLYDFGTISMANGDVSYRFKVENNSSESVKIEKIYTSCMCTTAKIIDESGKELGIFGMPGHGALPKANIEVESGESIIIETIFDPSAHGPQGTGKIKRLTYLETNSQKNPKLQLTIEAEVTK